MSNQKGHSISKKIHFVRKDRKLGPSSALNGTVIYLLFMKIVKMVMVMAIMMIYFIFIVGCDFSNGLTGATTASDGFVEEEVEQPSSDIQNISSLQLPV